MFEIRRVASRGLHVHFNQRIQDHRFQVAALQVIASFDWVAERNAVQDYHA